MHPANLLGDGASPEGLLGNVGERRRCSSWMMGHHTGREEEFTVQAAETLINRGAIIKENSALQEVTGLFSQNFSPSTSHAAASFAASNSSLSTSLLESKANIDSGCPLRHWPSKELEKIHLYQFTPPGEKTLLSNPIV